jgi:propionyl-CoA carboxylase alpha chain
MRERMGAQAIALARAVDYHSAGTVELIVSGADPTGESFYFLEMNTRLQVEHPVTEAITGIDLVEQMIRVAAGEKLAFSQDDIRFDGWAIEARLYAEDPYRDFLPSIGRLNVWRPPAEGSEAERTVRVDSGVVEGSEVSIHFDPLIAKIVTHGADRDAAIDAMADALDQTAVAGLSHNQPFLSALMDHPRWRKGDLSTALIDEEYPNGFNGVSPGEELLKQLAMVALSTELLRREALRNVSGRLNKAVSAVGDWVVAVGAEQVAVRSAPVRGQSVRETEMTISGAKRPVTVKTGWRPGEPIWSGTIDGEPIVVQLRSVTAGARLMHRGVDVVARVMTPRVARLSVLMPEKSASGSAKLLRCPMPGLVVAISVVVGQKLRAGEAVAIVEAMKMENVLRAERDDVVKAIHARPGDILAVDAVIVEFE